MKVENLEKWELRHCARGHGYRPCAPVYKGREVEWRCLWICFKYKKPPPSRQEERNGYMVKCKTLKGSLKSYETGLSLVSSLPKSLCLDWRKHDN